MIPLKLIETSYHSKQKNLINNKNSNFPNLNKKQKKHTLSLLKTNKNITYQSHYKNKKKSIIKLKI